MAVENVYQNIESILRRIDSIKRRFSTRQPYQFQETLQREIDTDRDTTAELNPAEDMSTSTSSVSAESPYDEIIDAAADRYRIPASLIRAVIKQESNFNAEAVSHKGAMGLMQLMPETADLLGVNDPFEPNENIFGGTQYLVDLINRYDGNLNKALAAYNAGPDRVQDSIPNFRETRNFVDSVLHYYESFSKTTDEEGF
jgi:soluble lytic murein transglycosylase-like protein